MFMNNPENKSFRNIEEKNKQETVDSLAIALSSLVGARVVSKVRFDEINKEKQNLLTQIKDIDRLKERLIYTECKLQKFVEYHSQWKPTTKKFEKRLQTLKKEKLYIEFSEYPEQVSKNLKEAYQCYLNGLFVACYIMTLRTIELIVNLIYEEYNPGKINDKGKIEFIPAITKLNWVKNKKMIGGADFILAKSFIEARNECVHEIFVPTDKQIISAFETVIILVSKLNK